ncbi:MAG: SirB2 family protein [Pseudomonadota bacterium]|nr:SirB2 family protein [Pseudomonadota bacterium]
MAFGLHSPAMYQAIKFLHVATVIVSGSLFLLRGLWMTVESPRFLRRWVRIVPHVNDTVLLVSAIALCLLIDQYPFVQGWLTAKVLLLVLYIGLGMVAMRFGNTRKVRLTAWLAALLVFTCIVLIALTKHANPLPYLV